MQVADSAPLESAPSKRMELSFGTPCNLTFHASPLSPYYAVPHMSSAVLCSCSSCASLCEQRGQKG